MKKITELEHLLEELQSAQGYLCAMAKRVEGPYDCEETECESCSYHINKKHILEVLLRKRKKKQKLTEDEKVILRNIDKTFKWIARDGDGSLFAYEDKPLKTDDSAWDSINCMSLGLFNHLFNFVKFDDKEPSLIAYLLKEDNYEKDY